MEFLTHSFFNNFFFNTCWGVCGLSLDSHTVPSFRLSLVCVGMNWWEMIYADDTMLIGKRARELNILIAAIEKESSKYNLRLNYKKCNYVAMNGKAHIHFSDGKPMTEVDQAMYLGGEINKEAGRLSELNNRINKARDL